MQLWEHAWVGQVAALVVFRRFNEADRDFNLLLSGLPRVESHVVAVLFLRRALGFYRVDLAVPIEMELLALNCYRLESIHGLDLLVELVFMCLLTSLVNQGKRAFALVHGRVLLRNTFLPLFLSFLGR